MNPSPATLQFFGAAGTVTGSKHLLKTGATQILLDCGLFQGLKELRLRNRQPLPFDAAHLDAVVLSHAHIDHSGYLPLLARQGFNGPVYCTPGTRALLEILLPDAAHIQEEEAAYANRKGFSKHRPALPLYTARDAERVLALIEPRSYVESFPLGDDLRVTFRRAGHILGSATIEAAIGRSSPLKLVFSGDLGRCNHPILRAPAFVHEADMLLLESTYGNRTHSRGNVAEQLAEVVRQAAQRGGALIVPAFAVGRAQDLMWMLRQLEDQGLIPKLPVYLDSPMATDATAIFCRHPEDHTLDMKLLMDQHRCPFCCKPYQFTRTPEESKALNDHPGPLIIISASGMATAGRVVHHLKRRLPDPRTTVLLVGFQAMGTRGRALQEGAPLLRIHGQDVPVRATIASVDGLSGHADRDEIARWLDGFIRPPRSVYVVHGEPAAAESLADTLRTKRGWHAEVARDRQTVTLE